MLVKPSEENPGLAGDLDFMPMRLLINLKWKRTLYAGAGILSKPFLSFFLKKIYCKYPQHLEVFLLFVHYIQKSCKISSLLAPFEVFKDAIRG